MTEPPSGTSERETRAVRLVRPAVDPARAVLHGWPYPFRPEPWDKMAAQYGAWVGDRPEFAHVVALIESVRASSARDELGGFMSMHDLVVRPLPAVDPPYDVVVVRPLPSVRLVRLGRVVVEHLSTTGHDDRIDRPAAEAVPLFWRFVAEKFGVVPR